MSESEDGRVHVCAADALEPGDREFVEVDGREVGVLNVEGTFYAASNHCPHRGGPVCTGSVRGILESEWPGPGERENEYYSDDPAVACPWHGWEFDLESGVHLGDSDYAIATYDVVEEDGDLYVEL